MNVYSAHRIQALMLVAAGALLIGTSNPTNAWAADGDTDAEAAPTLVAQSDEAELAAPDEEPAREAAPASTGVPHVTFQKKADSANHFRSDLDLAFRTQPLAIELRTRFYNQHSYQRNNTSILFSDVYVRAGAAINFSPAYFDGGVDFEFQPIRIFNLRATYLVGYNYGAFGYMSSFQDASATVKDEEWKALRGNEQSGIRQRVQIVPTFQIALGNIALMNRFTYQFVYFRSDDFDGPWLLASEEDRMVKPDGDHILDNMLFVGYKLWDPDKAGAAQFLLGPFYEWTRAVGAHKAEEEIRQQAGAENPDYSSDRHRVGLMAVLVPKHRWGKALAPHVLLQGGYNITDANGRDGNIFVQGALGVSFEGKKSR